MNKYMLFLIAHFKINLIYLNINIQDGDCDERHLFKPDCLDPILGLQLLNLWASVSLAVKRESKSSIPESCHENLFCCLVAKLCLTVTILWTIASRHLCPWDFIQATVLEFGCHFLSVIFLTFQGSNLVSLNCRQILYC